MKRNWALMLAVAGIMGSNLFGQQYPQRNGPYQDYGYDDGYYGGNQGIYAPAPPPIPRYAYNRPPMPGPDYRWVDGYWNYARPRYLWVKGYWARPPYAGGYWVAPRYNSGRFFVGFWGGGNPGYHRGNGGYGSNFRRGRR
jgi:hypothetical protein